MRANNKRLRVTYQEPLLVFHGNGSGEFENVSDKAGQAFKQMWSARGLAVGDFDNDGALDVLINNNGGPPLLLHNEVGRRNNWVGLNLLGRKCNIGAVGAWIRWGVNDKKHSRLKTADGSFLSSHDPREILGIGNASKLDFLEVQWPQPSGKIERFANVSINRYHTIEEGKGLRS